MSRGLAIPFARKHNSFLSVLLQSDEARLNHILQARALQSGAELKGGTVSRDETRRNLIVGSIPLAAWIHVSSRGMQPDYGTWRSFLKVPMCPYWFLSDGAGGVRGLRHGKRHQLGH
jgi:hypothetical protein